MPAVPPRGDEVVPQGRALLYRKVRDRKAQLCARTAWQDAETKAGGLWRATAREAEGQAHLRRPGRAVPALLRAGGADARHYRRDAAAAARTPTRQRRLPHRLGDIPPAGAAARAPRTLYGERPEGGYSVVLGQARRPDWSPPDEPQESRHPSRTGRSEGTRRAGMAAGRRGHGRESQFDSHA